MLGKSTADLGVRCRRTLASDARCGIWLNWHTTNCEPLTRSCGTAYTHLSSRKSTSPVGSCSPPAVGWCDMPLASRLQEAVLEAACCVSSRPPPRLSSRAPDLVSDMYAQTVASKQHRATYRAGSTKKSGVRRHSPRPGCRAVRESAARGSQPRHEGGLTRVSARVLSHLPHLTIDPLTHRRTSPCSPTAPRAACGTWPSFLRRR